MRILPSTPNRYPRQQPPSRPNPVASLTRCVGMGAFNTVPGVGLMPNLAQCARASYQLKNHLGTPADVAQVVGISLSAGEVVSNLHAMSLHPLALGIAFGVGFGIQGLNEWAQSREGDNRGNFQDYFNMKVLDSALRDVYRTPLSWLQPAPEAPQKPPDAAQELSDLLYDSVLLAGKDWAAAARSVLQGTPAEPVVRGLQLIPAGGTPAEQLHQRCQTLAQAVESNGLIRRAVGASNVATVKVMAQRVDERHRSGATPSRTLDQWKTRFETLQS